jgi:regulator of nucleoside diphosphate kinase
MLDTTRYQDIKMVQLVEMITDQDLERILHCLNSASVDLDTLELWEEKIDRAEIIKQDQVPPDLVTMRSKIKCRGDEELERIGEITLVFPHEANIDEGKISILAPLGLALFGARAGSAITWKCRNGRTRKMVIDSLSYQPEASGDWHL